MAQCYICETEIQSENRYKEHILLNSLGGKLKSDSLLCQECAPYFDKIDAALSNQLNFIGLLLNIKRDRGTNPPIKVTITGTGEKIFISAGGKPVSIKPVIQNSTIDGAPHLSISAKDKKQMREVLQGLKRKYPCLDVEAILDEAAPQGSYMTSPVHHEETVGGEEAFRAICKMAIGLYLHQGGTRDTIAHLIPYIKDGQNRSCVCFFYPDNFTALDGENLTVFHTLYVKGDPSEGILFAHIDFFSTFKFLVLLSDRYDGTPLNATYTFDVVKNETVALEMKIAISRQELLDLFEQQPHFNQEINRAWVDLKEAMSIKQTNDFVSTLSREAAKNFFKDVPEGSIPDKEVVADSMKDFMRKYVAFGYRHELGGMTLE
ncbi:HNH endonuclease [Geitlerinema sp. PCC 7407]|uniref:HNH endonuclease n=1 Tax=Geitlerinema sp. PCC 7407 TaxID=1173025 RepID=UPI00029F8254|nr:HNH endonuclease [Geitlerinema sp. PCC 7407]AFY66995.1 hypothetical protein GEI7407_2520 [Geitlerinema sp. PCC 7407]